MNWTELLTSQTRANYHATLGLVRQVRDEELGWKPPVGNNWMTVGQLLEHLTNAGGWCVQGFVTGDWTMPEAPPAPATPAQTAGAPPATNELGLPLAESMPSARSVADAVARIEADRDRALAMIERAGEHALATKRVAAPWDPSERLLGEQCLDMISAHLGTHKAQLFYYLKLLGRPVHTGHLWGMA